MSAAEKRAAVAAENAVMQCRIEAMSDAFDTLAAQYRALSQRYERTCVALIQTQEKLKAAEVIACDCRTTIHPNGTATTTCGSGQMQAARAAERSSYPGPTPADDADLMAECFAIYERWTK